MPCKGIKGKYYERKVQVLHKLRCIVITQVVSNWHIISTQILGELMRKHKISVLDFLTTKKKFSLRITKQTEP